MLSVNTSDPHSQNALRGGKTINVAFILCGVSGLGPKNEFGVQTGCPRKVCHERNLPKTCLNLNFSQLHTFRVSYFAWKHGSEDTLRTVSSRDGASTAAMRKTRGLLMLATE